MENKVKENKIWQIDWIKSLKQRIQKIEIITNKTEENISEVIETQDNLTRYIINVLNKKCWLETDKRFKRLKNEIIKKLKETKNLNSQQKDCINLSKEEVNKSCSLLKSFYDKTTKDKLTWLWNEEFINNLLDILWEEKQDFSLIYFDLNDLKNTNDTYWHTTGDKLILEFARLLKLIFWERNNYVARIHWDEFNIISLDNKTEVIKKLEKLGKWLENSHIETIKDNKKIKIPIHTAYWYAKSDEVSSIRELIHKSDKRMYENKIKSKQDKIDI